MPRIDPNDWSLSIDGLVRRSMRLTLGDLCGGRASRSRAFTNVAAAPSNRGRLPAAFATLSGAVCRFPSFLPTVDRIRRPDMWSSGADHGVFEGDSCEAFVKDLPLERVAADVLIAYEMNGAPLRPEHGYPARLVVPGYYGRTASNG